MSTRTSAAPTGRRLSPEARRDQLVRAAVAVIAVRGYTDFPLDEIADRAGVTRNLLYHYFPGGRIDVFVAAANHAGEELSAQWVVDPELPSIERMRRNFDRMVEQATSGSDAWRLHRHARAIDDPQVQAAVERHLNNVVSSIALNQLGTTDPSPAVRVALLGYIAFAETVLEQAVREDVPVEQLFALIVRTLRAVVGADD